MVRKGAVDAWRWCTLPSWVWLAKLVVTRLPSDARAVSASLRTIANLNGTMAKDDAALTAAAARTPVAAANGMQSLDDMDLDGASVGGLLITKRERTATMTTQSASSAAAPKKAKAKDAEETVELEEDDKGKEKSSRKRGGGGKKVDGNILKLVAKMTLMHSRELAHLKAAVIHVILFKADLAKEILTTAKDVTTSFFTQMSTASPTEKKELLSPHIYLWLALMSMYKLEDPVQRHWQALKKDAKVIMETDKETTPVRAMRMAVGELCRVFRINKCYDKTMMRMEVATTGHAVQAQEFLVKHMVVNAGGVRKYGSAPKGDMERRLERAINDE
eukprot:TRINITY_DN5237_c0_g2_i1.p1 TRINITY_DN5237_c0_g2~~TRINITY_DN5237_c0_g2_i1.p1  ORF type:complete len:332 (+),score=97.36 TRINITY_DN5237_c0_g2_i1:121-1116(+)